MTSHSRPAAELRKLELARNNTGCGPCVAAARPGRQCQHRRDLRHKPPGSGHRRTVGGPRTDSVSESARPPGHRRAVPPACKNTVLPAFGNCAVHGSHRMEPRVLDAGIKRPAGLLPVDRCCDWGHWAQAAGTDDAIQVQ